jgi:serine/threonine-protein kinase RsbW
MPPPAPTVTIPSATRYLARVRRFVDQQTAAAGLSERDADAVRLAVDEACANAIEHAYDGQETGEVEVAVEREPERFTVIVRHYGVPFDPAAYRPPNINRSIHERRKGGFGVALMHRLVDTVEYRQRDGASEVCLVKRLNGNDGDVASA